MHKKSLLVLLILFSKVLYSQTPKKENYLLLNYSFGYNVTNVKTIDNDGSGYIFNKKNFVENIFYFPSISFVSSQNGITEIEFDHLNISKTKDNSISNTYESLRIYAGIRNSYCFIIKEKNEQIRYTIGPEVYLYNGWQRNPYLSQKASQTLGINSGIVLKKSRTSVNNKYYFQTSLIIEPLRLQLFEGEFSTINVFKRNLDYSNYFFDVNRLENCSNCGILQVKFSIGPKL